MLSSLMKKSKQNYFTKFFENNLKNLENTWKGIKSRISMNKSSSSNSPTLLTCQNKNIDNPERIENIFNNYLSSLDINKSTGPYNVQSKVTNMLKMTFLKLLKLSLSIKKL